MQEHGAWETPTDATTPLFICKLCKVARFTSTAEMHAHIRAAHAAHRKKFIQGYIYCIIFTKVRRIPTWMLGSQVLVRDTH